MSAVRLFVYGSLRRNAEQVAHPLLVDAAFVGGATVAGTLYAVAWYPGLVLAGEGAVHGELYELPSGRADAILHSLDDYEGGGFRRRKVTAALASGDRCEAWTYAYLGPVHALEVIASGDYGAPVHRAHP
jgi:gamma-glutamylcyclotransferase (GGCT)/AIG2-like uncharacterized protein YtfP